MNPVLLCLVVAILAVQVTYSELSVEEKYDKLEEQIESCGKSCDKAKRRMKKYRGKVTSFVKEGDNSEKLGKCIDVIAANIKAFESGDAKQIGIALLDIGAVVAEFLPPPADFIFGALLSITSGFMAEKEKSMADIVREIVKSELRTARFEEIQDEFAGAELTLGVMQTMLKETGQDDVMKHMKELDVNFINAQVSATAGLEVMGKLRSFAQRELKRGTTYESIEQATTAVRLYIQLSTLRLALLMEARMFYEECKFTRTSHLLVNAVITHQRDQDHGWLEFLQSPRTAKEALVPMLLFQNRHDAVYKSIIDGHLKGKLDIDIYTTTKEISGFTALTLKATQDGDDEEFLCFKDGYVKYASSCEGKPTKFDIEPGYSKSNPPAVEFIKMSGMRYEEVDESWQIKLSKNWNKISLFFTSVARKEPEQEPYYMITTSDKRDLFKGFQPQPWHSVGNSIHAHWTKITKESVQTERYFDRLRFLVVESWQG